MMGRTTLAMLTVAAFCGGVEDRASAQNGIPAPLTPYQLSPYDMRVPQPVDAGHSDVNTVGSSLRQIEPGLRQPTAFEHVYQVPGANNMYFRQSGGLYAIFPQSVYATYGNTNIPLIPPGTVFAIGGLPSDIAGAPAVDPNDAPLPIGGDSSATQRMQTRVLARIDAQWDGGRNGARNGDQNVQRDLSLKPLPYSTLRLQTGDRAPADAAQQRIPRNVPPAMVVAARASLSEIEDAEKLAHAQAERIRQLLREVAAVQSAD